MTGAAAEVDASQGGRPAPAPPVPAAFAYLDLALLALALPIVVLAGAPLLGYSVAAGGWLVQRAVGVLADRYAAASPNPRAGLIVALAALFIRLWIVTLAVVIAARAGDRSDGLTARVDRRGGRVHGLPRARARHANRRDPRRSRATGGPVSATAHPATPAKRGLSNRAKVFIGLGLWIALIIATVLIAGKGPRNDAFEPQNEFKLDPWINLPGPFDINKAVFYVIVASVLTVLAMTYIARRMQQRPNRVQTAVEVLYGLMRDNITGGNMADRAMAKKWFPYIGTVFLFIWFSNLIGFIPLPTNTEHKVDIFGIQVPAFALYAATADLSVPLVLALITGISSYNVEGASARTGSSAT